VPDEAFNEVVQYASCVVHFSILLENKASVRSEGAEESGVPRSASLPSTEPLVLVPGAVTQVMSVVPKKCNVEMNGHRQAAKYDIVVDWKNLPLDPRVVKSITAEVHMGLVKPMDFARGQATHSGYNPSNAPGALRSPRLSVLNTRRPDGTPRTDTLVIRGIVDEWKTDYSNDSYEIHLQGRDLSGILMDSPLSGADPIRLEREQRRRAPAQQRVRPADNTPTARARRRRLTIFDVIDTRQQIGDLVRQILRVHSRMDDLRVVTNAAEWPNGSIPSPTQGSRLRRRAGGSGGSGASNMTFWDLITRYCTLVGAVCKVVGTHLEIRPSNALFGAESIARIQDESIKVVYGRDVTKMDVARKYAGNSKPKIIRCVSTDQSAARGAGAVIEAVWPPRNQREATRERAKNFDVRGGSVDGEELLIQMAGIRDVNVLLSIAQGIYEEIGRNEIEAHVETGRLTTSTGALGDIMRLRPGKSVELLVDTRRFQSGNLLTTTLSETAGLSLQAAARQLEPFVGSLDLARVMVASHRGVIMEQLRYFFCSKVKLSWSNDKGVGVDFDLQNYWWPRQDADRASGSARMGQNPARRRTNNGQTGRGANRPGSPAPSPARADPNTVTPRPDVQRPMGQLVQSEPARLTTRQADATRALQSLSGSNDPRLSAIASHGLGPVNTYRVR
jgi:hypothetical protein